MEDTQAYTDNPGALKPGLRSMGAGLVGTNLNSQIQDMKALANLTNRLEEAVVELQKSVESLEIKTIPLRVNEDRATNDAETAKPLQNMSPLAQRLDNLLYGIHETKYHIYRLTNEIDY